MPKVSVTDERLDGVYATVRDNPGQLTEPLTILVGERLGVAPGYAGQYLWAMRRAGVFRVEKDHGARKPGRGRSPVRWYVVT